MHSKYDHFRTRPCENGRCLIVKPAQTEPLNIIEGTQQNTVVEEQSLRASIGAVELLLVCRRILVLIRRVESAGDFRENVVVAIRKDTVFPE
ncbi:MAG: hypothetical protein GY820_31205 [Gammaproteobacteria bacterium]|nr:hypothetical protein [Gammaproteobacteria bacterium]